MADLKPCPFCGATAQFGREPEGGEFIACINAACGASTNLRFALMDDVKPMLAEQWNRRADASGARVTPSDEEILAAAERHKLYCWGVYAGGERFVNQTGRAVLALVREFGTGNAGVKTLPEGQPK